jgi:photosynthetic reaction center H subunit
VTARSGLDAHPGAPFSPATDPMRAAVGPGAYADRADVPDLTVHGAPKVVPMRADAAFFIEPRDPDPRGMAVIAADELIAGTVVDVWIDRAEPQVRYLEVQVASTGRTALLPIGYARIKGRSRTVHVTSIRAVHFDDVPTTRSPEQVTLLEEDKIMAYYAGGYLYADESRMGPVL